MFHRPTFYSLYRMSFGKLTQKQVDGLSYLLSRFEQDGRFRIREGVTGVRHIAYMLATTKHETADTYRPIEERGGPGYFQKYEPGTKLGRQLGNTQKGDGARFKGRGPVMITGRANYRKFDIEDNPLAALEWPKAYEILTDGILEGRFTGHPLNRYIDGTACDFIGARRCVNGTDRAGLIAGYAVQFAGMLSCAAETRGED